MACTDGIAGNPRNTIVLTSVGPFSPPWFADRIQSCFGAEPQMSVFIVAQIDSHTGRVLVAQNLQLCLCRTRFPQCRQVPLNILLCIILAPSSAKACPDCVCVGGGVSVCGEGGDFSHDF